MDNMCFIVWFLPITFMIHDFEEIVMGEIWGSRYKDRIDKTWHLDQPFALKYIHGCHTPTFSVGVEIIFVAYSLISFFSVLFQNYIVWYAFCLALILHYAFLHIAMYFKFKHYVPGVVTSVIFLIPNIWVLYHTENILHYSIIGILFTCIIMAVLTLILIPFLHKMMGPLSEKLCRYSKPQKNN